MYQEPKFAELVGKTLTAVRQQGNDEIIFELALGTVIHKVDSGINSVLRHFAVVWNVGAPVCRIVANKIVALAFQFFMHHVADDCLARSAQAMESSSEPGDNAAMQSAYFNHLSLLVRQHLDALEKRADQS